MIMPRDDPPIPKRASPALPAASPASAPAPSSALVPAPASPAAVPLQEAKSGEAATGTSMSPRHEAFCQHFVLLGNAADAAAQAGYASEWARNQGYRLMRQPRIQARVAEIRSGLARAYCLDFQVLLGKLEAVYQRAVGNLDFHAAARCVEIQARIAGHVPTRGPGGGREAGGVPRTSKSGRSPGGTGVSPENQSVRDREPTRGEDGRSPDRDTNKTTNDDIPGPFPAQKQIESRS